MLLRHVRLVNLHYSWLNIKELIAWNRHNIWSLSDSNKIQTRNFLLQPTTTTHNHLAKLAKWLSFAVSTYL